MEPMEAGATAAEAAARHRTLPALRTFTVGRTPMEVAATLNMFPTAESTYQTRRGGPRRRYSREVRSALGVALLAPTLVGVTVERGERAGRRLPSTSASVSIAARKPRKRSAKSENLGRLTRESTVHTPRRKFPRSLRQNTRSSWRSRRKIALWRNRRVGKSLSWRSFRFEYTLTGFRVKESRRRSKARFLSLPVFVRADVSSSARTIFAFFFFANERGSQRPSYITPPRPCPL